MHERYNLTFPKWGKIALILVLTLGVLGGFASLIASKNRAENAVEAIWQKSFYDLIMDVNDMEIKLEKLTVSNGATYQRELLLDVGERATLANSNISQLSSEAGVLENTTRYINQVGDFAKSLYEKINEGGTLSQKDRESLKDLHLVSVEVGKKLSALRDKIGEGARYLTDGADINGDFSEIDDISVDYPELIYDGPFSDSVVNKEPKGLTGAEIDEKKGLEIAKKVSGREDLEYKSEWSGKIKSYNYASFDGETLIKLGYNGQLLVYSTPSGKVEEMMINEEDAVRLGYEFLYEQGFEGLVPVWYSVYDGNVFVNYVSEQDGVIIYNDMVKVKVSGKNGKVVGFEGTAYAYNHVDRDILTERLTEDEVIERVNGEITIREIRLALVPKGQKEILTYEVFGEKEGKKYFIYLDALSGEEVNILCVIDSDQGDLLM